MYKKILAAPYVFWVICGTLIPLLAICYYGLTDRTGKFTLDNLTAIAEPVHLHALGLSLGLAILSTVICLILSIPLALVLKGSGLGEKGFIIFIFILPMWMNFLLRTMAWQVILEKGGIFSTALEMIGLKMPAIINTPAAIVVGMVYDFLPFMVLPIYNALMRIDDSLIEAAQDLGAPNRIVLRKIILPLCIPGIASGITMVFVPGLTTFVISNILGGGKIYLIGNIIEQEFTTSANWNLGSGLSLVMMLFILVSMWILSRLDKTGEGAFL
ncbi:MAG: ABC transporter permease [Anaerovoracaceae bacterium]|jgi:spermidine/putrescine transport system permease protein